MMEESGSPISNLSDRLESPSQVSGRHRNRLINIIKQNNLPELHQFVTLYPSKNVITPGTTYLEDTLFNTASYGSSKALNIPLEVYTVVLEVIKRFNPKFDLLLNACGAANLNIMRFILDCHNSPETRLALKTVNLYEGDNSRDTPIIVAIGSPIYLNKVLDKDDEIK
ncbi:hypothetical protein EIK77_007526 [Talaromyces pinophilus]|nr:hypothetical protein EIK77_007526 [Talaromyces pinophilus]